MQPTRSCHQAQSYLSDFLQVNQNQMVRHNRSLIECSSSGRRLRDIRVFEGKSGSKCTPLQQAKVFAAAAEMMRPRHSKTLAQSSSHTLASKSQSISPPTAPKLEITLRSPAKKSVKRRKRERDVKVKSKHSCYSVSITETPRGPKHFVSGPTSGVKQLKNRQNIQDQDDTGMSRRMDVIAEEEEEEASDDDSKSGFESEQSKKVQESCASFLNIVHDAVMETVQSSVQCILKDYLVTAMEKIESLCSQVVRNDSLMSKMYTDIMEKITIQNEKNQRQFKGLCQYLMDIKKYSTEPDKRQSFETDCNDYTNNKSNDRCHCGCKGVPDISNINKTGEVKEYHESVSNCEDMKFRNNYTVENKAGHGSNNPNLVDQLAGARLNKNSNINEQFNCNRGFTNTNSVDQCHLSHRTPNRVDQQNLLSSRTPNIVEQHSNLGSKATSLVEQLSRSTNLTAEQINNLVSRNSNLVENLGRNSGVASEVVGTGYSSINAFLVEKLCNSRDAINSMLAEKLKGTYNSYSGEDQKNHAYEPMKSVYAEEVRNLLNLMVDHRAKEFDKKLSVTVEPARLPTESQRRSPSVIGSSSQLEFRQIDSQTNSSQVFDNLEQSQRCSAHTTYKDTRKNRGARKTFSNAKTGPSIADISLALRSS